MKPLNSAGILAVVVWATMLVGVVLARAWGLVLSDPWHDVALAAWCIGLHLLALRLYRRDMARWRAAAGKAPQPDPKHDAR